MAGGRSPQAQSISQLSCNRRSRRAKFHHIAGGTNAVGRQFTRDLGLLGYIDPDKIEYYRNRTGATPRKASSAWRGCKVSHTSMFSTSTPERARACQRFDCTRCQRDCRRKRWCWFARKSRQGNWRNSQERERRRSAELASRRRAYSSRDTLSALLRQLPRLFIESLRHRKTFVLVAGCQVSADRSLFPCRDHDVPTNSVRSRQAVVGRARHAVAMVQGVGAIKSEHRDAVTETPQGGQGQAGLHADPGIAERRGHGPKYRLANSTPS